MAKAKVEVELDLDRARAQMAEVAGGQAPAPSGQGAVPPQAGGAAPSPSLDAEGADVPPPPRSRPGARKSRWAITGARERARAARVRRKRKRKRLSRYVTRVGELEKGGPSSVGLGRRSLYDRFGRSRKQSAFGRVMGANRKLRAIAGTLGRAAIVGGAFLGASAGAYLAVDQTRNMLPIIEEVVRGFLQKEAPDWLAEKIEAAMDSLQTARAGVTAVVTSIGMGIDVAKALGETGTIINGSQAKDLANRIYAVQYAKARGNLEWGEASLRQISRTAIQTLKETLRSQLD